MYIYTYWYVHVHLSNCTSESMYRILPIHHLSVYLSIHLFIISIWSGLVLPYLILFHLLFACHMPVICQSVSVCLAIYPTHPTIYIYIYVYIYRSIFLSISLSIHVYHIHGYVFTCTAYICMCVYIYILHYMLYIYISFLYAYVINLENSFTCLAMLVPEAFVWRLLQYTHHSYPSARTQDPHRHRRRCINVCINVYRTHV